MEFPGHREIRKFMAQARKDHTCDTCGGIIKAGENYWGTVLAWSDTLITSRDHLVCEEKEPTKKEWLEAEFAGILEMFPTGSSPFPLAG